MSLITTQDLSDYLGRDVTLDDGATFAVASANQVVLTLTEQDFEPLTSTVHLDGRGTDTLLLPQRPVNNVGTVTVNGVADTSFTFTGEGHLIRTSEDEPSFSTWSGQGESLAYWPAGRQNIAVTYEHGGTVPDDVRMVALMIAYRAITQGGAIDERVGDVSKRYAVAATDLTAGEKAILHKYRR